MFQQQLKDEDVAPPIRSGYPRVVSSRLDWYSTLPFTSCSPGLISLDHMGKTLCANPNFGTCVLLNTNKSSKLNDTRLRNIVCVTPDHRLTVEVLLLSHGLSSAYHLSRWLVGISEQLQAQLSHGEHKFGLPWLQKIIVLTAQLLHSNSGDFDHKSEATLEVKRENTTFHKVSFWCVCM